MAEEVIRYGAGGVPYKGNVGPHSSDCLLYTSDAADE